MHAVLVLMAADIVQLPFLKRIAAVYEVVALRREAAQHAVLLLRGGRPARESPQPVLDVGVAGGLVLADLLVGDGAARGLGGGGGGDDEEGEEEQEAAAGGGDPPPLNPVERWTRTHGGRC